AVTTPYVVLRLINLRGGAGENYLAAALAGEYLSWRMIEGAWQGLRALWLAPVLAVWLIHRRRGAAGAAGLAAVTALTLALCLFIAADYSRAGIVALPCAILGCVLLRR